MPNFRFSIYCTDGSKLEDIGSIRLSDDTEARAFGTSVIQDLLHGSAGFQAAWMMDVAERDRAVCSIPFNYF